MDDFLKKLKTRVDNLEVPNQGEVNEDALWESIQIGISEDVDDNNPKGFLTYIPLLLAVLLVVGGIGFYLYDSDTNLAQHNDNTFSQQISDINPTPKTESNKSVNSSNGKDSNQKEQYSPQKKDNLNESEEITNYEMITSAEVNDEKQEDTNVANQIQKSKTNTDQIANQKNKNELGFSIPAKSIVENENKSIVSQKVIAQNQSNIHLDVRENVIDPTNTIVNTTKNDDQIIIEKQNKSKIDNSSNTLPSSNDESKVENKIKAITPNNQKVISSLSEVTITSIPSIIEYIEIEDNRESLDLDTYHVVTNKKNRVISLGLFAGSHLSHTNLSSNLSINQERKDLLNNGIKPQLGYSATAELTIQLHKNLNLITGIEYVRSVEQFNYNTTWDTTFQNGQNPDITINQVTERIVQHYNRHSFLSIPVLLGMDFQKGKFGYGASLGVGVNFIQSQQGRSLDNNLEVVNFPTTELDNLSPRPDFYLSYLFRPYINYQLKDNLKIQVRPDLRFQNYGASTFYNNMKFSSIVTGLQAGIVFDLK